MEYFLWSIKSESDFCEVIVGTALVLTAPKHQCGLKAISLLHLLMYWGFALIAVPQILFGFQCRLVGWSVTVVARSANHLVVVLALHVLSAAGKGNRYFHKTPQQCWEVILVSGFIDFDQIKLPSHQKHQQMSHTKSLPTAETSHGTSNTFLFLAMFPPETTTLIYKWNAKFTFICKKDFGPLSKSSALFPFSPDYTLLMLPLVQD